MPAPEYQPRSDLVKEAEAKAGNYEWSTAARLYSQALGITETSENSRIAELLAKSLYKAARQSKTREEFDRRMGEAKEAYENASQRYSKTSQQGHSTRMLARARFAEFWLADDSNSKRNIIAESARLAEESAKSFEAEADTEGQAMSHRDLLDLLPEVQIFAVDYETKKDAFMNFMAIARKESALQRQYLRGDDRDDQALTHIF